MIKPALSLLVAAALSAGTALAQTASAPAAEAAPGSAAAMPAPTGKQLEGVTVVGKRPELKKCNDRDKACIAQVVAELHRLYPEQLKIWCNQEKDRFMWENMEREALFGGNPPPLGGSFQPAPVTKVACVFDKKPQPKP
jgi:hypothetical protein